MLIRPHYRKKDGKRHAYWVLVDSYRTERGPRQRVVAYLGQLDEEKGRLGVKRPAEGKPKLQWPKTSRQPVEKGCHCCLAQQCGTGFPTKTLLDKPAAAPQM